MDEINERVASRERLEGDHREWLCADLVTTVAGFVAEEHLLGDVGDHSAEGDVIDAVKIAGWLGFKDDSDGGGSRIDEAISIAREVVGDLATPLAEVANALTAEVVEIEGPALAHLLEDVGVVAESHRAMLQRLSAAR